MVGTHTHTNTQKLKHTYILEGIWPWSGLQSFNPQHCSIVTYSSMFEVLESFITKQATSDATCQFWRDFILIILLATWHCLLHVCGHSWWQVFKRWLLHTGHLMALITANWFLTIFLTFRPSRGHNILPFLYTCRDNWRRISPKYVEVVQDSGSEGAIRELSCENDQRQQAEGCIPPHESVWKRWVRNKLRISTRMFCSCFHQVYLYPIVLQWMRPMKWK